MSRTEIKLPGSGMKVDLEKIGLQKDREYQFELLEDAFLFEEKKTGVVCLGLLDKDTGSYVVLEPDEEFLEARRNFLNKEKGQ